MSNKTELIKEATSSADTLTKVIGRDVKSWFLLVLTITNIVSVSALFKTKDQVTKSVEKGLQGQIEILVGKKVNEGLKPVIDTVNSTNKKVIEYFDKSE